MQTQTSSISDILSKNSTSFFIPPFQRSYAWEKAEIDRYFDDIKQIIKSEHDDSIHDKLQHFFGTLVIKNVLKGFANNISIIVDGQQRITTTMIFLIALRDKVANETEKIYIQNNYLFNLNSDFNEMKLTLKQGEDWEAYKSLIEGNDISVLSNIESAYNNFCELITQHKKDTNAVFKDYITALTRLNVVVIILDENPRKGEDPQIIFETLNSIGKPLALSDLIRK